MNRQEFIEKLKSLLKVSREDQESLIEEYESYFEEAMNNGETEEQIISNLETPEEIAANANEELGVNFGKGNFKDYVDVQFDAVKEGYEKVVDSDFISNVGDTVEEALKGVGETLKGLDIEAKVSKALEKVGAAMGKMKDVNFEATFKDMAMKFDNSRVETFEYSLPSLSVKIEDENRDRLSVEVIGGTSNLVIKSLPTTMQHTIGLDENELVIHVPQSSIKYAEKKRMRIYVPNSVEDLKIVANVPMTIKDLETGVTVENGDAPLVVKDVEGDKVVVSSGNAPLSVKDIEADTLSVMTGDGPVTIKDFQADDVVIHVGDGPMSVKNGDADTVKLEAGNGPQTIKFMDGTSHSYKLGSGPKTVKSIDVDDLTIEAHGGLITIKDISVTRIAGDITGTVKTLKDIEAESFELNK